MALEATFYVPILGGKVYQSLDQDAALYRRGIAEEQAARNNSVALQLIKIIAMVVLLPITLLALAFREVCRYRANIDLINPQIAGQDELSQGVTNKEDSLLPPQILSSSISADLSKEALRRMIQNPREISDELAKVFRINDMVQNYVSEIIPGLFLGGEYCGSFILSSYPETEAGRASGIKTLKESGGDLLLISDPDSDRLSVTMQKDGNIHTFTGNEVGIIFLHYLATNKDLPSEWASITTIVSTPLCKVISEDLGGSCFEVLTGFKYIAELIQKWEESGPPFILGFEESLGYLSSTNIRDKDAVLAACQISEIALQLSKENQTLLDYLCSIYDKYGVFREGGASIEFDEKNMLDAAIAPLMKNPPTSLLDQNVSSIDNYATSTSTNLITGTTTKINLPTSNVLTLHLEDGSRYIFRPSGTEPKIKIYASLHEKRSPNTSIQNQIQTIDAKITSNLTLLKKTFFH